MNDHGLEPFQLGRFELGVAQDDDPVANGDETGGGAVEADLARTANDGVSLEPRAVVDVDNRTDAFFKR